MIYEATIKPKKPKATTHDHEFYFTKRFTCPKCGTFLGSYDFGRAWTADGMAEEKRVGYCRACGEPIDWSGVPFPKEAKQ